LHPWVPCNKKHGGRTTGSTGSCHAYAITIRLANGCSVRRSVTTITGETRSLCLVGDINSIKRGDLALFGTTIRGGMIDVIVKNIERGDNLTVKLTAVDAAPINVSRGLHNFSVSDSLLGNRKWNQGEPRWG
jgi:hypothetical protein